MSNQYQLVYQMFGLTGRYLFADIDDDLDAENDRYEHRAEAELRFIHPTGWSAGVLQGFRYLDLDNRPDNETIYFTDVELGFELPGKRGKIGVLGRNVFDHNFNWVTDDFTLGGVIPRRSWLFEVEVNF